MLVRFEVDACIHSDVATQQRKDKPSDHRPIPGDDPNDLLAALQKLTIRSDDKIEIVSCGELVPQDSIIEIATKSEMSLAEGMNWGDALPQLFISQTPHHYLGVHRTGKFSRIEKRELNDKELLAERRKQQLSYDKLRFLLEEIKDMVIERGENSRLSLVYRVETKNLEVFERKSTSSALPDKWFERFKSDTQEVTSENEEPAEPRNGEAGDSNAAPSNGNDAPDGSQAGVQSAGLDTESN